MRLAEGERHGFRGPRNCDQMNVIGHQAPAQNAQSHDGANVHAVSQGGGFGLCRREIRLGGTRGNSGTAWFELYRIAIGQLGCEQAQFIEHPCREGRLRSCVTHNLWQSIP